MEVGVDIDGANEYGQAQILKILYLLYQKYFIFMNAVSKIPCLLYSTGMRACVHAHTHTHTRGQTAIFVASMHGQTQAVRCLCSWAAADLEIAANGGGTCVGVAAARGHVYLLRVLLDRSLLTLF